MFSVANLKTSVFRLIWYFFCKKNAHYIHIWEIYGGIHKDFHQADELLAEARDIHG